MKQIGKYAVIKELGSGGFGAVYLAEDPRLGEKVAIKERSSKSAFLTKHGHCES